MRDASHTACTRAQHLHTAHAPPSLGSPQCASCPACPSHGTVAGGFSPLSVVRDRALLAQAAEPPLAAYRALEAPTLLLPILGLVLASVAANVLLVRGIARKQAALVKEVVPEW